MMEAGQCSEQPLNPAALNHIPYEMGLVQWLSIWIDSAPPQPPSRGHLATSGDILVATNGGEGAGGFRWAAQEPHNKNYPTQNGNSARSARPWIHRCLQR